MPSLAMLIPGDLDSRTGGYAYDRRIIAGLRELRWTVTVGTLDASYPQPSPDAQADTRAILTALPDGATVMIDGLAFGAMAEEAECEKSRLRLVALVHHPLAAETGMSSELAARLAASERRALACARRVVVTSRMTAAALAPYGVPAHRIAVVEPGTDPRSPSTGSQDGTLQLLCVASVVPRKGYEILIDALGFLRDRDWHLTCVGSLERDPDTVMRLRARIDERGLADRVTLAGELGEAGVARCYDRADLFVLPTYYEGYGMAVAEALAHGLLVISTPTGAIPDLVGRDAGVLVPAGDVDALMMALADVMDAPIVRARLAAGARDARVRLATWNDSSRRMADVLGGVAADE
jgi:glycosyltransferase involved in cell wall biosynthesis